MTEFLLYKNWPLKTLLVIWIRRHWYRFRFCVQLQINVTRVVISYTFFTSCLFPALPSFSVGGRREVNNGRAKWFHPQPGGYLQRAVGSVSCVLVSDHMMVDNAWNGRLKVCLCLQCDCLYRCRHGTTESPPTWAMAGWSSNRGTSLYSFCK